jgi:cardiolipin synthase
MNWNVLIFGIIVPIFHAVGIVMACHAILFARTSSAAIAWAFSLVTVPYVSAILYLVFGRRRFQGYVEARRAGDLHMRQFGDTLAKSLDRIRVELTEADRQRLGVMETLAGTPFTAGNAVRLLVDGDATFAAIFEAIESAKRYLLVQFFIIRDDDLGRKLRDKLVARARAGVKVFFLYDEIGCIALPTSFRETFDDAGVLFRPFRTSRGLVNRFQINFRNHRKIVIADGNVAYVGGHNVGVEYLGKVEKFGRWRDTHIEIRGPAVGAIQLSFFQDWHWATDTLPELDWTCPPADNPGVAIIAIPSSPADAIETCTLMFLTAISAARTRVWITSPYFVPDETVYDALQLAALRGVDVRIMLPAKPDHKLVYLSSFSYFESAEAVGVKFYRYQNGFLHQKVMLIDDDLAAVGTANLDNRSMRLNFEITIFSNDTIFAKDVESMLIRDFADCTPTSRDDLKKRSLWFRLGVQLARLLSPIQ